MPSVRDRLRDILQEGSDIQEGSEIAPEVKKIIGRFKIAEHETSAKEMVKILEDVYSLLDEMSMTAFTAADNWADKWSGRPGTKAGKYLDGASRGVRGAIEALKGIK